MPAKNKKIVRLLGVGFDTDDAHVRITHGSRYDVLMGSDESHAYLQELMQRIETLLHQKNTTLDHLTPEEFIELVRESLGS